MKELQKIIRRSGNFNCFYTAEGDLVGMVSLLWTMALLSRPFRYADGKLVEQQGFLLLDLCPIQPLKDGGCCSDLNFMIVPQSIAKRNSNVIPSAQSDSKFCGESTRILQLVSYNGENLFRKIVYTRSLRDLDQFLTQSAKILNQPLTVSVEPDRTPLPYFTLLEHEFSALPVYQTLSQELKNLKALFAESTGMLEAAALVLLDAATLGNPDNVINRLLTMATAALNCREAGKPDATQQRQDIIDLINGLMKQRFKHDVLASPAKFEESLYRSLFSQTPLPLIW